MTDRHARVFAERARLLAQPLVTPGDDAAEHRYLFFTSRAGGFAVPLASAALVRTITEPQPVTGGPPWLLGLAAIAGRAIPVVDMRTYLSGAVDTAGGGPEQRQLVIVVEADAQEAALVAETVDGIGHCPERAARRFPSGTSPRLTEVSSGLCGKRVVLDPERLVQQLRAAFSDREPGVRYHPSPLPTAGAGELSEGV